MRRVIAQHGASLRIESCICSGGFGNIKLGISRYKNASRVFPHIVLTDLDQHTCASELMTSWKIRKLPPAMLFRIAVRSIESWLLADRERIADFLSIPMVKVTHAPEALVDSKRELFALARGGRRRRMASEICPEPGSVARQGPLYNAHMVRFVNENWRVEIAAQAAQSLARTCQRIRELELRLSDEQ